MSEDAPTRCETCGQPCAATPFGPLCSWDCFDVVPDDPAAAAERMAGAPAAFAYFLRLGPGVRVDDEG
ncbi:hypothetical protein [Yinghuangia soli]|uniref:Uncharacterized protein n=1 Tax=Yinghuangia soli TaxID=2908204 RepID=A0AA41U7A2_9ACTN|nr:hypothetical protein [Yinghuangia soli]MCF2531764.1 hypothetical protein [Yinghuangia soli]